MVYVWEFEFFDSDGMVDAVPCGSLGGGGTFGSDLNDAVESAADFLACMVDDHLMGGVDLPAPDFGHQPQHGGKVIAVAVSRELGDIPAVTAALSPLGSFEALLLEMSLETVMGIPPVPRVMKTEKTDRATW